MAKIDYLVEKSFLEAVEKKGKPRSEITPVEICDTLPEVFGEPGSLKRRDIQEHWNNVRRRSIRSYTALLDKFEIAYGAATTAELLARGTQPSDDEASVGSPNKKTEESTTTSSTVPSTVNNTLTSASLASLSRKQPLHPNQR